MKSKTIFSVIVIAVLCIGKIYSQIVPATTKAVLSEKDKAILDQHLCEYTAFTIDKRELIDSLYTYGTCRFRLNIDQKWYWMINLEFNDMRTPDFRQIFISDSGEFEMEEPFLLNTFKGETSENQIARFTIDENTFFGVILGDREHYVIRPVKEYTQNPEDNSFIVYKSTDIISENQNADYINDALKVPHNNENENSETDIFKGTVTYTPCTYYLLMATEADYEFYINRGNSSLARTYGEIFSVLNIVSGVYESTFRLKILIEFQSIITTPNNPYTSTNASTLLDQFQTRWNSQGQYVIRNVAHLFTGKTLDGGIWGASHKGHLNGLTPPIINSNAYSLSMDRIEMYQTTTHEIGHNSDAYDNPQNCFCGTSNASVMCQGIKRSDLWFCAQSINEISPFIRNRLGSQSVTYPASPILSGSLTGFNLYYATQTITSTQVINSGFTSYKAGTNIVLSPGFHAVAGSGFRASIESPSDCDPTRIISPANEMTAYKAEIDEVTLLNKMQNNNTFDFTVYPNPNEGNFTVQLLNTEEKKPFSVQIFNSFGVLIAKENCNSNQYSFNCSGLPSGIYYVRLTMDNNTIGKSVVIK